MSDLISFGYLIDFCILLIIYNLLMGAESTRLSDPLWHSARTGTGSARARAGSGQLPVIDQPAAVIAQKVTRVTKFHTSNSKNSKIRP
jgi:hypothetical protein